MKLPRCDIWSKSCNINSSNFRFRIALIKTLVVINFIFSINFNIAKSYTEMDLRNSKNV